MSLSGPGNVLTVSNIDRFTSRDVKAFEVPSSRDEQWRFTPFRRLHGLHDGTAPHTHSDIYNASGPPPVVVRTVAPDDPGVGLAVAPADRVAAQAWCSFTTGLHVAVPADTMLDEPVMVAVNGPAAQTVTYGHIAIHARPYSKATVVVDYRGSGVYAENVELIVGESADLTVVFLHTWDSDATHVTAHHTMLGRSSRLRHVVVTLGGDLVRVSPTLTFAEEGAEAELAGLCFAQGGQHFEHRPVADHAAARCVSRVLYKCAAHGSEARSVWIGDAVVRAGAAGTDTYVANRNILLSGDAHADAVPCLEIETSDILRAGHESATGRLETEELFYLMSRGIPEDEARRLVLRGFFGQVIGRIGVPAVEERVRELIDARLAEVS